MTNLLQFMGKTYHIVFRLLYIFFHSLSRLFHVQLKRAIYGILIPMERLKCCSSTFIISKCIFCRLLSFSINFPFRLSYDTFHFPYLGSLVHDGLAFAILYRIKNNVISHFIKHAQHCSKFSTLITKNDIFHILK